MPWHQSKANPCKVYNSRHEEICICQTPEEAARTVRAANEKGPASGFGVSVKSDGSVTGGDDTSVTGGGCRAAANITPITPFNRWWDPHDGEATPVTPSPDRLTNFVDNDECCAPRLAKALRKGVGDESWVCPKCGCTWIATVDEANGLRRWSPEVLIAFWR